MTTKPFDVGAKSDAEEAKQKRKASSKKIHKKSTKKEIKASEETKGQPQTRQLAEKYTMGEAAYNPRVNHNEVAWDNIRAALKEGKGVVTHKRLCEVLKQHAAKTGQHHQDFIGYMVRRGSLAVVE